MVGTLKLLMISFIFATGKRQLFEEPPLCGKSVITNTRFKRVGEMRKNNASKPMIGSMSSRKIPSVPYVTSVQKFDTTDLDDGDIFDRRLSGAFVGTILGPAVVLVACRCVARHMGRVGGEEESTEYTRQFGVMAGTPFDFSPMDGIFGQIRFTSRIVFHPKCELRPSIYLWDLAVLVLKSPFQFIQNKVEAAPIPKTSMDINQFLEYATIGEKTCFTIGWGWAFNSHKPKNLEVRIFPLFVREYELCNHSSAGYLEAGVDPTIMPVCIETAASYLRHQKTGDAGSPLLGFVSGDKTTKAIQYIVLGIKSVEDDATPDGFALFTRLDIDLDWLWNITRNHPAGPRDSASSTNFTPFQFLLFIAWTRTFHILGIY